MLVKRAFHGEEFYKFMLTEYEAIRVRRKSIKGKPDDMQRIELEFDKMFETFYKGQL